MSLFASLALKGLYCAFQKNVSVQTGFTRNIYCFKTLFCPSAPILMSNGLHIPPIGFGTRAVDHEASFRKAIRSAVKVGFRYIDTSFQYWNEPALGKELQQMFKDNVIMREQLFIATKLPQHGMRPENVEYFFRKSLNDLQLDYVDLYSIHAPFATQLTEDEYDFAPFKDGECLVDDVDLRETWKVMESLVHKGLVKSLGLGHCNIEQVQRIYDAASIKPTNLQVECHPFVPQHELHEFCNRLDISLTAHLPLGPTGQQGDPLNLWPYTLNSAYILHNSRVYEISKKHKKTQSQVLLRYLTQRGIIPIPRSYNEERMKKFLESFDFNLDSEDFDLIKTLENGFNFFTYDYTKRDW